MAGFGFTEEQEMFRREVRRFVQTEMSPGAAQRAKREGYPKELIKKMGDMGLLGLNLPAEYGGQPADWVSVGIAMEEIARVDTQAYHIPIQIIAAYLVLQQGSEELRQEWMPALIRGDKVPCLAITEPDCGSDAAALKTRAVRDGDFYILNGEKTSITLGSQADMAVLFAKTDPTQKARGITSFVVPLNLPGITRTRFTDTGWKALGRSSIVMDDVRLPIRYRVGDEGKGFYMVMGQFDFIRVCLGLGALAAAHTSLEEAIAYAKQRNAFGRPIARFEAVSFKIAEHATFIEAARLLCYRTLWLKDQGLPHTKESAMCKWLCPKIGVKAIHDSLLIHGHVAYSEEFPIEQRLRDTMGLEMADGTAEIMKLIISREIMGREFLPY